MRSVFNAFAGGYTFTIIGQVDLMLGRGRVVRARPLSVTFVTACFAFLEVQLREPTSCVKKRLFVNFDGQNTN